MVSCTPFTSDADQLMSIEGCLTIKEDPPPKQNSTTKDIERGKHNEKSYYTKQNSSAKKKEIFFGCNFKAHTKLTGWNQICLAYGLSQKSPFAALQGIISRPRCRACSAFTSSPKPSSELAKLPNNLASCSKISLWWLPLLGGSSQLVSAY